MAQRKTLTVAQLEILRWIGEGCPDGVYEPTDPAHRISAAALARRGLVETTGRGPGWSASITETGRSYLKRADGPDAPEPRQANVSVTQELIDEVIAAGGSKRYPARRPYGGDGEVDYRHRALLAERYGRVPDGKRLIVSSPNYEEVEIRLVDLPDWEILGSGVVPVPDRVSRYHRLVKRFRDSKSRHEVSRAALPRALRILQGIVVEAERRGWAVSWPEPPDDARYSRAGWSGNRDGHISIEARENTETIRITEEGLGSRAHWEQSNRTWDRWSGEYKTPPISGYEEGATGRLEIEIVGYGGGGRQSKWGDRRSWTLEEKLPEVLREIELRAVEVEERRSEAERLAAERKLQWEVAMEEAKRRWFEAYRGQVLAKQAEAWRNAENVRAYVDAMAESVASKEAEEWVAWSRSYAETVDPLRDGVRPPEPPDSVPLQDLKPFLGGWSPYGPERDRSW